LARTVRALVAGEEVDFGAVRGRLRWSLQQAPIFFSGDGPRVLRTAGMVADGVILGGGLDEATLQRSLRLLAEGAASAGRDPQTLERWIFAKVSFGATEAEALEPLRATLAAACQRNFRHNPVARGLPPALVPAAQAVIAQYAFGRHGDTDAAGNARLLTDPDLMRFLADRFALYGTPAQVRQQIARIAAAGFHQFLLVCSGPDPDTLLEALGHEIVAPFRARSAG
jgi:5,10-methylenetetrahydromethanopterin reductase